MNFEIDNQKEALDTSLVFLELNGYFSRLDNKSFIKVKEIFDILIPYIRGSRRNEFISYGKTLSSLKEFRAPMSKKQWSLIIDSASLKEME